MTSNSRLGAHWDDFVSKSLDSLRTKGLLRQLRPVLATYDPTAVDIDAATLTAWYRELNVSAPVLLPQETRLKLFSLNDYMGLSAHPRVCLAAARAAACSGMGPRSSAVVGGYTRQHRDLESALAGLKETEEALLFPSGFAANQAAISALAHGPDCAIFSDELNHASIIDGARLARASGARLFVYRHNDMGHLETLLQSAPESRRKLVVTDSLFSMDGDFADLDSLVSLRRRHGFLLAVDEAHATLVCGDRGGGATEMAGVSEEVDLHIGTLSKAVGAQGGFVACRRDLKSLLLNRGRPYVFSTALPLPTVAAAHEALNVAAEEPWRREHLWSLVARLGSHLGVAPDSPIVPLILGEEAAALRAAGSLLARGFHVPAIRPPTVKPHTCRLRISLSAAHTTADVDALAEAIAASGLEGAGSKALSKL